MSLLDWLFRRTKTEPTKHDSREEPLHPRRATAPVRRPDPDLPNGGFRFIALDVETSCSDAASICQTGLACVSHDNQIQTFSTLVNPNMRFDPFNIQLHGIGPDQVESAPQFDEALSHLIPLLSRHQLVQHSHFDKRAIPAACGWCKIETPDFHWADSVRIARRAWPELTGNGGHGLKSRKKVPRQQFDHHDAGEDARAAAMVVLLAETHQRMTFDNLVSPEPKRRYPPAVTIDRDPVGVLAGSIVVFTGRLGMSRTDAAELAARSGMTAKIGVTKKTPSLVVGDRDLKV